MKRIGGDHPSASSKANNQASGDLTSVSDAFAQNDSLGLADQVQNPKVQLEQRIIEVTAQSLPDTPSTQMLTTLNHAATSADSASSSHSNAATEAELNSFCLERIWEDGNLRAQHAIHALRSDKPEIAIKLINQGVDLNASRFTDCKLLHLAAHIEKQKRRSFFMTDAGSYFSFILLYAGMRSSASFGSRNT